MRRTDDQQSVQRLQTCRHANASQKYELLSDCQAPLSFGQDVFTDMILSTTLPYHRIDCTHASLWENEHTGCQVAVGRESGAISGKFHTLTHTVDKKGWGEVGASNRVPLFCNHLKIARDALHGPKVP